MKYTPEYLRREQAAEYLRSRYGFSSLKSLAKEHALGIGPAAFKMGRIVLYRLEDLDAYAAAKIRPAQNNYPSAA